MTVTATLVTGAGDPAPVQLVVTGIPAGVEYLIQGTTADGTRWLVPGGDGVGDGGAVSLVDNRSALNVPVTYRATWNNQTQNAAPVQVNYASKYGKSLITILQSLDGRISVELLADPTGGDPRDLLINGAEIPVPGRRRPPGRYTRGGDGGGTLSGYTVGADTAVLHELLLAGKPIVQRTSGFLPGVSAVDILRVRASGNRLRGQHATDYDKRLWTLPYTFVDDPEPSTAVSVWTWEDFDAAMATRTGADFDALFAALTGDDFDVYPWGQLL